MIRWPLAQSLSPIGLDIGSHSLHAVQLRRSAGTWETAAAVSLPRTTPSQALTVDEIERLRGTLERRGFVGREAVIGVPVAGLLSAMLELPARAPGVPIGAIAAAEFGRVHKVDPSAVSMATWDLPASARATKATFAMAVGVKADTLRAHVDLIESAGLSVCAVDDPLSAVARGAQYGTTPLGQTAVVDFGHESVRLAVVHGRTLAYARTLAEAGTRYAQHAVEAATHADAQDVARSIWQHGLRADAIDAAVADALGAHVAAVLREMSQAFGYAARQYPDVPVAVVRLAGGGAMLPGIAERFTESLDVPAAVCGDGMTAAPLTLARGLALFEGAA